MEINEIHVMSILTSQPNPLSPPQVIKDIIEGNEIIEINKEEIMVLMEKD